MKAAGIAGVVVLLIAWGGPLPGLVGDSFTLHMVLHMAVVGVAVPLIALGLSPWARRSLPGGVLMALCISLADMMVVWAWHSPLLHQAARQAPLWLAAEQLSFFTVSLLVWLLALGGRGATAALSGALSLFFTSMHMTLLGALLALSLRDLYPALQTGHSHSVADQQIGGAIMLVIGGVIYLGGALALMGQVLRQPQGAP